MIGAQIWKDPINPIKQRFQTHLHALHYPILIQIYYTLPHELVACISASAPILISPTISGEGNP